MTKLGSPYLLANGHLMSQDYIFAWETFLIVEKKKNLLSYDHILFLISENPAICCRMSFVVLIISKLILCAGQSVRILLLRAKYQKSVSEMRMLI